jgi:hypothetical protein
MIYYISISSLNLISFVRIIEWSGISKSKLWTDKSKFKIKWKIIIKGDDTITNNKVGLFYQTLYNFSPTSYINFDYKRRYKMVTIDVAIISMTFKLQENIPKV